MVKVNRRKGQLYKTVYERTKYGSYVDISEYGMCQQKNAMSLKELKKYGYKPVDFIEKEEYKKLIDYNNPLGKIEG